MISSQFVFCMLSQFVEFCQNFRALVPSVTARGSLQGHQNSQRPMYVLVRTVFTTFTASFSFVQAAAINQSAALPHFSTQRCTQSLRSSWTTHAALAPAASVCVVALFSFLQHLCDHGCDRLIRIDAQIMVNVVALTWSTSIKAWLHKASVPNSEYKPAVLKKTGKPAQMLGIFLVPGQRTSVLDWQGSNIALDKIYRKSLL